MGVRPSSQQRQKQRWGRVRGGQVTFSAGLLELAPGSLDVALHQSLDDAKAVRPTLPFSRPFPCPRVGLQWKTSEFSTFLQPLS